MKKTILICVVIFSGITIRGVHAQCSMNSMHQSTSAKTDTLKQKEVKTVYYQCPMHKEITSDKPGQCSICGINLEKVETLQIAKAVLYTCPMHPDVTSNKPGHCPKCLMELVPWEPQKKPHRNSDSSHSEHSGSGGGCH